MASGKGERNAKPFKRNSLGPKSHKQKRRPKKEKVKKKKKGFTGEKDGQNKVVVLKSKRNNEVLQLASPSQQLEFFVHQFQSANGVKLSSLELDSITENCIVKLPLGLDQDASNLGEHLKIAFGSSWEDQLCENQLHEGKIELGSPAVLIFSAAALRSLDLLRGLHALTRKCHATKLFSKHMKVENQVSLLKNRINIASGTPSRDEFWDLYKTYFHQLLLQGKLRVCLYGPIPVSSEKKTAEREISDDKTVDISG